MKRTWLTKTLICVLGCGASPSTASGGEAVVATEATVKDRAYVDAVESLPTSAEKERWYKMISDLNREFDDVCGDSFCEGEYSEIEPIFFRCSVARASGELRSCVWVFGETEWDLDERTGAISIGKSRVTACTLPVTGKAAALTGAIHGLDDKLPGTDTSISEALQDCL